MMCLVLIASPIQSDRQFLRKLFQEYFFNVTFLPDALSAEEAYYQSFAKAPDLFILDLSGSTDEIFQYKTKIVKRHPNMKVILLDDEKNFTHLHTALRCGAIDYLVKPLQTIECQSAIHRAILALNQVSLLHYERSSVTDTIKESAKQMLHFVHEHYDEELQLETLAQFMHLNKSYVSRFFKETVGMTFVSYLRHYRIEQAKKYLKTTDETITEIAKKVGYPELTYFSRIFKKETSFTPNEYRQRFQGIHTPPDFSFIERRFASPLHRDETN